MKRSISLVLCLAIFMSVFSVLGVTASAVSGSDLFYVSTDGCENGEITYNIYLNAGVSLCGATIRAEFDPDVLEVVEDADAGAYMVDDGYGDMQANVSGLYISGLVDDSKDTYAIAFVNTTDVSYKSRRAFMKVTFRVKAVKETTSVKFSCYEFISQNAPENNIEHGDSKAIDTLKETVKGVLKLKDLYAVKDGLKITWYSMSDADEYIVYRKAEGSSSWTKLGEVSKTSYTDESVANNTKYAYTVKAVKGTITSEYNKTGLSIRYLKAPSSLTATIGVNKVTLSWTKVSGATYYTVSKRIVNSDGTYGSWTTVTSKCTDLKYTDTKNLKSGKTYQYTVRAAASDGKSGTYCYADIAYVGATTLKLANKASGVNISWDKVAGAVKYRVYRKYSGESSYTKLNDITTTSYTDTTVTQNKKVYYAVRAYDANNKYGGLVSASTTYLKTPTPKVSNISTGVKISWDKISGATQYTVYRKASGASKWTTLKTVTGTSYTDTTAKSGTTYYYSVKAANSDVKSSMLTNIKILYLATPKVTVSNLSSGVKVSWNKITGAKGYYVYRKASGAKSYTKIATIKSGSTLSYTDKTAKAGTKYYYTVKAYNGSTVSSTKSSDIIKRLTMPALKSVASDKSGITFKWSKVTGAEGYIVYRKTGTGSWVKLATVKGGTKVSYLDKSAKKGTTYTYTVRAYSGDSTSSRNTTGLKVKDKY